MPKAVCKHFQELKDIVDRAKIRDGIPTYWENGRVSYDIIKLMEVLDDSKFYGYPDKAALGGNFIYYASRPALNCNCENVEDLKEKISVLESQISSLRSGNDQQVSLRRNTETDLSSVKTERNNLQIAKRNLESRLSDLQSSNWSLQSANSNLSTELERKDRDIEWGKRQLATSQRNEREKQAKVDELTRELTALQITNNNINTEIENKKNEIKNLKGDLSLSREEFLSQKVELKDEKLETLIQQLGVERTQLTALKNFYQQLINARTEFNQTNISNATSNISNFKSTLLTRGISVANSQKVCRKCEKLVKLELELNQIYQQQFEARQEVPLRQ